jgi:hypothetical protein
LCSNLSASSQANCIACTGSFFNNGAYCIDSSYIANYNPATSSCSTGSIIQNDPYYGISVTCTCILGSYYLSGTSCIPCDSAAPGGSAACTSCLAVNGYFASTLGCIYCPNLLGSNGIADPNGNGCGCIANYYWNTATSTCDCDFWNNYVGGPIANCIYCPHITGTTAIATAKGCGCINGWWQPLTQNCLLICNLNTSFIVNSTCYGCDTVLHTTSPNANNTGCICTSPY